MPDSTSPLHIDGLRIAYQWTAQPSTGPLLILHGLGDSSIITFAPIANHPALRNRPCLLLDLPGFGYSSAPDDWPATMEDHAGVVLAALDALEITRAAIAGHSMGGSIALLVAHRRPDLVSALILAEPLLQREQSTLGVAIAKRREEAFVTRGYEMLRLATRRQAARGDKAAMGFREPLDRADPAILHRSATSLLAERSPTFPAILASLPMPGTLLIGERTTADTSTVPTGVEIIRIPDAGHSMMSEQPGTFATAVSRALSGSPRGGNRKIRL